MHSALQLSFNTEIGYNMADDDWQTLARQPQRIINSVSSLDVHPSGELIRPLYDIRCLNCRAGRGRIVRFGRGRAAASHRSYNVANIISISKDPARRLTLICPTYSTSENHEST